MYIKISSFEAGGTKERKMYHSVKITVPNLDFCAFFYVFVQFCTFLFSCIFVPKFLSAWVFMWCLTVGLYVVV